MKKFTIDTPPANGDGRRFYYNGNFEMTASGILNNDNETLEEVMNNIVSCSNGYVPNVTYSFTNKQYFILSGFCGEKIFYRKSYVGKTYINNLYLVYSKYDKALYDQIVTHISHSFKPGILNE